MRVANYKSGSLAIDPKSTPRVRLAGVEATLDHSSEQSVIGWQHRIQQNTDIFNRSPLAERLQIKFTICQFLRILKGMNGDHASNEKSTARGMENLKRDETIQELGEEALSGKSFMDLVLYLAAWNEKKIAESEGLMPGMCCLQRNKQSRTKSL